MNLPRIRFQSDYGSATQMRGKFKWNARAKANEGASRYGSATQMRGKSSTCRNGLLQNPAVYDRGSETRETHEMVDGKS